MRTKDDDNVGGRVAFLQLNHQRMGEKAYLRLVFVLFQGSLKSGMENGRMGTQSKGSCIRHGKINEEKTGSESMMLAVVWVRGTASDNSPAPALLELPPTAAGVERPALRKRLFDT